MAYYKDADGNFSELESKNVDTGMGFERLCMVLQNKDIPDVVLSEKSVYDTDIFQALLEPLDIEKFSLHARRIIADHSRTAAMLIQEGLSPSNEWRGYVLRRIIRRMYFQWYQSEEENSTIDEYLNQCIEVFKKFYSQSFEVTAESILSEVTQFDKTIKNGKQMLESYIQDHPELKILPWDQAFKLYDTFGYPVDLTKEVAKSHGWKVDIKWYDKAFETAKEIARAWSSKKFAKWVDRASVVDGMPQTEFVWYETLETEWMNLLKDYSIEWQRVLIFDRTPMYAESWGQKWDSGVVVLDSGEEVKIGDVQQYAGVFLHMVK